MPTKVKPIKSCMFTGLSPDGPVRRGWIDLYANGDIMPHPVKGHETLFETLMAQQKAFKGSSAEWFASLPLKYTGTYLSAYITPEPVQDRAEHFNWDLDNDVEWGK